MIIITRVGVADPSGPSWAVLHEFAKRVVTSINLPLIKTQWHVLELTLETQNIEANRLINMTVMGVTTVSHVLPAGAHGGSVGPLCTSPIVGDWVFAGVFNISRHVVLKEYGQTNHSLHVVLKEYGQTNRGSRSILQRVDSTQPRSKNRLGDFDIPSETAHKSSFHQVGKRNAGTVWPWWFDHGAPLVFFVLLFVFDHGGGSTALAWFLQYFSRAFSVSLLSHLARSGTTFSQVSGKTNRAAISVSNKENQHIQPTTMAPTNVGTLHSDQSW